MVKNKYNKFCNSCNWCKKLYEKTHYGFMNVDLNYCIKHEKMIELKDTCYSWKMRKLEYEITIERIDNIENDVIWLIKHLKQIFK